MSVQFQVLPEEVTLAEVKKGDLIASQEGRFIGLVTDASVHNYGGAALRRVKVIVRYWFTHDRWAEAVPGTTYVLVGDDADTVNPVKVSEVPV